MKRVAAALLAIAVAGVASVYAQQYPSRPVRLVVPYSSGGAVDIVARIVGQKLTDELGQQVIVDNRAGGGGNIGVEIVAKAAPDGHTLLMGANGPIAINPSLYPKLAVDPLKDLAPISVVASSAMILVTHPSLPASSVTELIALAKTRPGAIAFASSGSGSTSHLSSELFKSMARVSIVHIPYKGAAPALIDVVSGQVQMMFTAVSTTLPFVRSGKLKALAVSSEKRLAILPGVPTVSEGLPGYEVITWYGAFAPAQTPGSVTGRLHQTLAKVLAVQDAQARIAAVGADPMTNTPQQFGEMIRREHAKWARIIRESGARVE